MSPAARTGSVSILAHAKVNLTLQVLGRRPDGFHELRSLMVPLALADRLTVTVRGRGDDRIEVEGHPELENTSNLAYKAAGAFRAAFGLPPVSIRLTKRIPIAAGLGGGSSDAAAVLRGLALLRAVPQAALTPLAEALGSDVPFFLREVPALASGRGERLSAAPEVAPLFLLLCKPPFGISASEAYRAWQPEPTLTHHTLSDTETHRGQNVSSFRTAHGVAKQLSNDLQRGCLGLYPKLASLLQRLARLEGLGVSMSGSGSTCFAVFERADRLRSARDHFEADPEETVIATRTLRRPSRVARHSIT